MTSIVDFNTNYNSIEEVENYHENSFETSSILNYDNNLNSTLTTDSESVGLNENQIKPSTGVIKQFADRFTLSSKSSSTKSNSNFAPVQHDDVFTNPLQNTTIEIDSMEGLTDSIKLSPINCDLYDQLPLPSSSVNKQSTFSKQF